MADVATRGSARFLVVDDEERSLLLMRHILGRAGYLNVETESDSSRAVERYLEEPPDLLLLDLHMPDPDGLEVLRQLRERRGLTDVIPILVLTGDATSDATEQALDEGASDVLVKPFQHTEMLLRVRNLLSMSAAHRALQAHDDRITQELHDARSGDRILAERRLRIEGEVEHAMTNDALRVVYQPVVDLVAGTMCGVEALARFDLEPPRPPDVWFLEAAEVGLGVELELRAIELAVRGFPSLPAGMNLSVNASPPTLLSPRLDAVLEPVPGWRMIVELTEHQVIDDYEVVRRRVETLRERGIRLAVDDTGSGHASLHHILRLQPDVIKLDRSLITGIDRDPVRRSLITSLIHFADESGTQLIGEGIETDAELRVLRSLGLTFGQGFLLGRPAEVPQVEIELPVLVPLGRRHADALGRRSIDAVSFGEALHSGPTQELSAACVRLQLLQRETTDEVVRAEQAVLIGMLRRTVTELGDIVSALQSTG